MKCEQITNICQAKCANPTDCGQGLTCDEEVNTCYDPMVRKKLEAERKAICIALGRCVDFIKIPGGSFMMGSNDGEKDEKPVHRVHVKSFYMSKTEVTVGQYRACFQAGACSTAGLTKYEYCNWNKPGRETHPINCVDWFQARAFAIWAGGDLPSEAQWEYAARGGEGNRYKYAGSNNLDEVAWYEVTTNDEGTRPVGQKKANGYGLFDLSGNVWEWTWDHLHNNYDGAPTIGRIWAGGGSQYRRIFRGGGWVNKAFDLRLSSRNSGYLFDFYDHLGFRIVRNEKITPSIKINRVERPIR